MPIRIKTLFPVWADPQPAGLFTLKSENFVKIPTGTEGIIEDDDKGTLGQPFDIILFPGGLRARLKPGTFEVLDDE